MAIQISKKELEELIEKKVREALIKALMELTPYVSDEEQEEIEEIAGNPEDYDESDFETCLHLKEVLKYCEIIPFLFLQSL